MTLALTLIAFLAIASCAAAVLHPLVFPGETDARELHRHQPAHQELALEDVA